MLPRHLRIFPWVEGFENRTSQNAALRISFPVTHLLPSQDRSDSADIPSQKLSEKRCKLRIHVINLKYKRLLI